jgi:nucleotide-binding universal stress UspA family protein
MINLKRILLPTDFSSFSQPAVKMACRFAEEFNADLHLLHVSEEFMDLVPDFVMGINLQSIRDTWTRSHDKREAEVVARLYDALGSEWTRETQTSTAVRKGKPFVEIVRYAREHDIDLIVMGTHGRGGIPHVMLGSVAENVVRQASCPVLTVRPADHQFEMAR